MKQSPRHTCCIRSLRSIEEKICIGPLTAKTQQIHQSPIYSVPPCSPFLSLNTELLPEKTFSMAMGFQKFMSFADCGRPRSHPRRKRKESSPKVITGYRQLGDHTRAETEAPDMFRERRKPNPRKLEGQCLKQATCVFWGCSCAPLNKETCPGWKGTLKRDASSHGGKSTTATANDQRDSRGALLRAGCRHEWKDTENPKGFLSILQEPRKLVPERTQPWKRIVRNEKQVFWT